MATLPAGRLVAGLLGVALVGCGGETASPGPDAGEQGARMERVAQRLDEAGTLAGTFDLRTTGADPLHMTGEMTARTDGRRQRMTGELTSRDGTTPIEMRQFGLTQYVRTGARWIRSQDATPSSAVPFGELFEAIPRNPDIELRGTETVQGRPADHFSGPFDMTVFDRRARGATALLDVWVADDDLPRRLSITVRAGGETATTVIEVERYGVPFTLRRPPARLVDAAPG